MERKDFLKKSCMMCMAGMAGWSLLDLLGCTASKSAAYQTEITGNQIKLPLALFTANDFQLVRPKGWFYDIAVLKTETGYEALLMKCTHMDNQLQFSSNGYTCSLHGSMFDRDGNVRKGPAEKPLKKFQTNIEADNIIITI